MIPMTRNPVTGIYESVFPNGLKLLVLEKHHLPIVTVTTWYRTGSIDSVPGKTGVAHFIEHLMFKGTQDLAKGEIDRITQRLGGSNNAFTSPDYTCYYFNFRSDRWEKALEIEADRMVHVKWDSQEFESERRVILEEIASSQDAPFGMLAEEAEASFFKFHPYRYPIAGWKEDMEAIRMEEVADYYTAHYMPNNAVLVIVGDVEYQDVARKVEHFFGAIPSGHLPQRKRVEESPSSCPRRLLIKKDVEVVRFNIVFRGAQAGTKDDYTLDLLDILLSSGRGSRLYKRLVLEEGLLQHISSLNDTRKEPGMFWIVGQLLPSIPPEKIEEIVLQECNKLKTSLVGRQELEKARNIFLASFIFQQETAFELADKIGQYEMCEGHGHLARIPQIIQGITPQDVRRVAQKYLDENSALFAWAIPSKKRKVASCRKASRKKKAFPPKFKMPRIAPLKTTSFNYGSGIDRSDGKLDVRRHELPNGLTVLVLENHALPFVSMKLHCKNAIGHDPEGKAGVAYLVGRLLTEGTAKRSAEEMAAIFEFIGGSLAGKGNGISCKVLSKDFSLATELLSESICCPDFPTKSLKREKEKAITEFFSRKDDPMFQAGLAFRKIVYREHPYSLNFQGYPESLSRITRKDLRAYHKRHFSPSQSVLSIVGDVKAEHAFSLARGHFGAWNVRPEEVRMFPTLFLPERKSTHYIPMDKQQLMIHYGHLGIRRDNPDYYTLLVLDQILGQGEGFTDRISKKIRDEMGLCYSIECSITSDAGPEPGTFAALMATSPENYSLAIQTLEEEIVRLQREGITEEELESVKASMTGNFIFALEENESLCSHLISAVRFNLGFDYITRFPQIIERITREQVQCAAQNYLHPEIAALVVVGPVDKIE